MSVPSDTASRQIGAFERRASIGKGSFANVYQGIHKPDGKLVAIKSVNLGKLNKKLRINLQSEISILKELKHPHIVRLFDCQSSSTHIHLVMEYCELGDLSYFIKYRDRLPTNSATAGMVKKYPIPEVGGLHEVVTRHFLKQLTSAVKFLRGKQLIHRDIKPQNLLLAPSRHYRQNHPDGVLLKSVMENVDIPLAGVHSLPMLKVADFGFARSLPTTSLAETLCGSPLYMAPEILRYEKYDAKADLWSVGTVLFEMVNGKPPFRATNHVDLLRRIEQSEDQIKFITGVEISRPMKEIIRALLKRNPVERMSFEAFFDHEVITQPIPGLIGEDRQENETPKEKVNKPASDPLSAPRQTPVQVSSTLGDQLAEAMATSPVKFDKSKRHSISGDQQTGSANISPSARGPSPLNPGNSSLPNRRPALQGPAATAPNVHQPRSATMERGHSGDRPIPGSPLSQEYTGDDIRDVRREQSRTRRRGSGLAEVVDQNSYGLHRRQSTRAEIAAQDVQDEREYVVINTRSVEVNALADQMAADPRYREEPRSTVMVRRATTQGAPGSATGAVPPQTSHAVQIAQGRPRIDHQRLPSYDTRPGGQSPGSVTSVLGKAIAGASLRLLGVSLEQKHIPNFFGGRGASPPSPYYPVYPVPNSGVSAVVTSSKQAFLPEDEDSKAISVVEDNATRSDVVYGFAEVKYRQLIPLAPSMEHGLGGNVQEDGLEEEDDGLTADAIVALSEEALVLYVKTLSLLAKAMDAAQAWWHRRNQGGILSGTSPRSNPILAGNRINAAVQWIRGRFNEVLEKAGFVRAKLIKAQKELPEDHPGHPSQHNIASKSSGSKASGVPGADDVFLTSGITAEKLIYDRAIEMSRSAAINEISNTDLGSCEMSYTTAIRMLEAVLESDGDEDVRSADNRDTGAAGEVNGIDTTDREAVNKILANIRQRLHSLRKKRAIIASNQNSQPSSSLPQRFSRPSSLQGSAGTSTPRLATPPK